MILAIPVNENRGTSDLCVSLGGAPRFFCCNTEPGAGRTLDNPVANAKGGSGVKVAQFVADQNMNALITVLGGKNAAEVLITAVIQICRAQGGMAKAHLAAFAEGKLQSFHAGFHHQQ